MGRVRIAVLVMTDSLLSRVIDANGTVVVEYTYDAWGKVLNVTGDENLKDTLGEIQPFRGGMSMM